MRCAPRAYFLRNGLHVRPLDPCPYVEHCSHKRTTKDRCKEDPSTKRRLANDCWRRRRPEELRIVALDPLLEVGVSKNAQAVFNAMRQTWSSQHRGLASRNSL